MPQVRSEQELKKIINKALQEAVQYVVQKIWNENREVVRVVVYEAYHPKEYKRTGEFKEAWATTAEAHNPTNKDAYGKFYYKPNEMSVGSTDYNAPNYAQHIGLGPGRPGENNENDQTFYGKDSREYLADIIYGATKWGGYFGDGAFTKKRDAWAELNRRIGKRKIKQWMKEGMERAGFDVQMHNAPLYMTEVD